MGAGKLVRVYGKMDGAKYGSTWNTLEYFEYFALVVTSQNVERFKWYKCFLRLCNIEVISDQVESRLLYLNSVCLVMCIFSSLFPALTFLSVC